MELVFREVCDHATRRPVHPSMVVTGWAICGYSSPRTRTVQWTSLRAWNGTAVTRGRGRHPRRPSGGLARGAAAAEQQSLRVAEKCLVASPVLLRSSSGDAARLFGAPLRYRTLHRRSAPRRVHRVVDGVQARALTFSPPNLHLIYPFVLLGLLTFWAKKSLVCSNRRQGCLT